MPETIFTAARNALTRTPNSTVRIPFRAAPARSGSGEGRLAAALSGTGAHPPGVASGGPREL